MINPQVVITEWGMLEDATVDHLVQHPRSGRVILDHIVINSKVLPTFAEPNLACRKSLEISRLVSGDNQTN